MVGLPRSLLSVRLSFTLLCILFVGCDILQKTASPSPSNHSLRPSAIERLHRLIQTDLSRYPGEQEAIVLHRSAEAAAKPAHYKPALLMQILSDPWRHLVTLERHSLLAADMAEAGIEGLPAVVDILEAGLDRTAASFSPLPFPTSMNGDDLLLFFTDALQQAYEDREKALRNLTPDERLFLFTQAASIVDQFSPHRTGLTASEEALKKKEREFARLLVERLDYASLITAAQRLTRLGNEYFLRRLAVAFSNRHPVPAPIPGVTGDVLFARATSYGLVIIGGSGPNGYHLDARFSLVIDLGGADVYRGSIGASQNTDLGNSVVIDLGGNDTYEASSMGLATGRAGVGVVMDLAGDDVYQLAPGSGGAGFAGLGILYDGQGNDRYLGTRFTQGAAFGGLGLLIDGAGDDQYTSHGYAIGLGAPLGVGVVIDISGNDSYRCGSSYPSSYNSVDVPDARPADPKFQYDCFGLGTGVGARVLSRQDTHRLYNLAGGWGLLLDLAGNDTYDSANFSQGLGYFFGIGSKLDLDGTDSHGAARYGHGVAAHSGVGLFIDGHGSDRYRSSGPFYNGAGAWDSSVALLIDAGESKDVYDFSRTTGLGIADQGGWAAFIDEGGNDRYVAQQGLGLGLNTSTAFFIDLTGTDEYETGSSSTAPNARTNKTAFSEGNLGLFLDR